MTVLIANPNRVDESVLSGGSWVSTLPLTNLQKREIPEVARTTNTLNSSTTFNLSLAKSRRTRVFAFVNHNLSNQSTYRIRSSNEQATTNLLTYSEQFDNSAWVKTGTATVTPNTMVAPDGIGSADTVSIPSTSVIYQAVTAIPGNTYTMSLWLRASATTTVTLVSNTNLSDPVFLPLSVTTDWQRFSLTRPVSVGTTTINLQLNPISGSANVYAWGAQIEAGSVATSYYPTTSAPATRPAGYIDTWQSYDYDSGVIPVWEAIYPTSVLYWEDDNFWTGQQLEEDKIGYNLTLIKVLDEATFAQHYRVDFFDQTNPDGYVQIGRMFLSDGWQPVVNMSYGATMSYEDETEVGKAKSGSEYFDVKKTYRVAQFSLDWMKEDEGFSRAFDLQRLAGIHGEVLYMWDTNDTIHRSRRSFLGRLRKLSPLEMPNFDNTKMAFEIKELL